MSNPIEIKIVPAKQGKRVALYRTAGISSKYWHCMPVRQAEKALKTGRVSIGLAVDVAARRA